MGNSFMGPRRPLGISSGSVEVLRFQESNDVSSVWRRVRCHDR